MTSIPDDMRRLRKGTRLIPRAGVQRVIFLGYDGGPEAFIGREEDAADGSVQYGLKLAGFERQRYLVHPDGRGGFGVAYDNGPYRGCNAMPGATSGFKSLADAELAIRCLEHVGGERNAQRWWDLYHRVSGVTSRSRREQHDMAARLGYRVVREGRHTSRWVHDATVRPAAVAERPRAG